MEESFNNQPKQVKKYSGLFKLVLIVVLIFLVWVVFTYFTKGRAFNECQKEATIYATMPGNIKNQEKAFNYLYVNCMKIKGYTVDPILK